MTTLAFNEMTIAEFRDIAYDADGNTKMMIPFYDSFQAASEVFVDDGLLVLGVRRWDEPISVFEAVEASRDCLRDEHVVYIDEEADDYVPVTRVEKSELDNAIYLS